MRCSDADADRRRTERDPERAELPELRGELTPRERDFLDFLVDRAVTEWLSER